MLMETIVVLMRFREGSLNFLKNTQQVATACGTHVPRQVPPQLPARLTADFAAGGSLTELDVGNNEIRSLGGIALLKAMQAERCVVSWLMISATKEMTCRWIRQGCIISLDALSATSTPSGTGSAAPTPSRRSERPRRSTSASRRCCWSRRCR